MIMISAKEIKLVRDRTGAGIADVKRALEEAGGDIERASAILERRIGGQAAKKAGRETRVGILDAYVHANARVASLVEVWCETDFVARNELFKAFAHDIALQIAAMNPQYLSLDSIPREAWEAEKMQLEKEAEELNKPTEIKKEIVEEKLISFFEDHTLLTQRFVKNGEKTIGALVQEMVGRFGENIQIGKFVRFSI